MLTYHHPVPVERAVFLHEMQNGFYHSFVYYITKSFSELPFQIIFPVLFGCIEYWMIGLQNDGEKFAIHLAALVVVVNAAQSFGECTSKQALRVDVNSLPCANQAC